MIRTIHRPDLLPNRLKIAFTLSINLTFIIFPLIQAITKSPPSSLPEQCSLSPDSPTLLCVHKVYIHNHNLLLTDGLIR
jgi:hypothetical protein